MAGDVVIRAEGLSKKYVIGHEVERQRSVTLRDVVARGARNIWRKTADMARGGGIVAGDTIEEFWALKDVRFEVKRGEVLGIIGRNGAGKSTLLKVLSRITEPTEGRVAINGRVASLLEVGTGFHPELTGRENIYLNGAILGMTRAEIRSKFEEIVAFAEVDKFLDTPVKRYSSGMYVRLAFAVAAHLEPEILIVDEVLAVGDATFQKKCLGKIDKVAREDGRTVLLVSHNMSSITALADRALLLESGSLVADGPVSQAVSAYVSPGKQTRYVRQANALNDAPYIERAEVTTSDVGGVHRFGEPLEIRFWVRHAKPIARGCFSFHVINQFQQAVIHAFAYHPDIRFGDVPGCSVITCRFPELQLNVGQYYLRCFLSGPPDTVMYDTVDGICSFEVLRTDRVVLWGWRADACVYHEKYTWNVADSEAEPSVDRPALWDASAV
jgi:ABC-type polysaccharide/polyol phosphate transport system ATPase subunit